MMSSDKLTTDSSVFLKELAKCSEKAANIARIIKSEKYLFQVRSFDQLSLYFHFFKFILKKFLISNI